MLSHSPSDRQVGGLLATILSDFTLGLAAAYSVCLLAMQLHELPPHQVHSYTTILRYYDSTVLLYYDTTIIIHYWTLSL